jgi:hypothetical protein
MEIVERRKRNLRYKESVRVMYLGYHRPLVTAQKTGRDRLPPAANSLGTIHPVPGNGSTTPG